MSVLIHPLDSCPLATHTHTHAPQTHLQPLPLNDFSHYVLHTHAGIHMQIEPHSYVNISMQINAHSHVAVVCAQRPEAAL